MIEKIVEIWIWKTREEVYRRDETVIPNTSSYNLRPRRGAKVESRDQPMRRGHNKEEQFDPEEAGRNNSTDPTCKNKFNRVKIKLYMI
ncbi:hypothetical protein TNCV_4903491 [Trichonephila clavipes]|uniref:Uncharacterized protein n=1 Tax=Trichonephila clavipes TaxID=2585209 RepID=A0A8X6SD59_TRICX|nr:hypothetical protein TNCV_4903491 [Trichonephila clavipes]